MDAPPVPEASATEEGEPNAMRVSVSWASARDGADDVLGATAYDGAVVDVIDTDAAAVSFEAEKEKRAIEPQTKEGGRDLDDVPVPGAPRASFDALLEASLASASDPRAATHNAVAHSDRETWERCPSGTFELLSSE